MEFYFSPQSGLSISKALSLEWLEINALGGYASSTVCNCHTRKYHGLLVSKLEGITNKIILLSNLEDSIVIGGTEYFLTAHQYPNFYQDGSFENFTNFHLSTHPYFQYKFANGSLSKEILLLREANTIFVKYKNSGINKALLKLRPLFACRDFHVLSKTNDAVDLKLTNCSDGFYITPYAGLPTMYCQITGKFELIAQNCWYHNFIYEKERERGYEYTEDLFTPAYFTLLLEEGAEVIFSCNVAEAKLNIAKAWDREVEYRKMVTQKLTGSELQKQLKKIARSFIQKNNNSDTKSVIAGYHWFQVWGRDAMIALPGLTFSAQNKSDYLPILREFCKHEKHGLIPNFIGSTPEENAYNSVDASLWFVWAVQQYYMKTKDLNVVVSYFWKTLTNIYNNYKNGTLYNIKMTPTGLLCAGNKDINLTWMDAVTVDGPVSSRYGFQVEINALWYNMLCFMYKIAQKHDNEIACDIKPLLGKIANEFCQTFWDEKLGYLYDYVHEGYKDAAIRPNQVFAVSLPYSPLPKKIAEKVLETVRVHLLTPYGLRTLAASDKNFIGFYHGDVEQRDKAYHNGTIWPWLLGHFAEAYLKITNDRKKTIALLKPCLHALYAHLSEAGIGSVSEVFFGSDKNYRPDGCISQAWNVAEILRLMDILSWNN
jgi:predicted glycogen debranching enzyme